jgi:alpha-L-arabinofuranosidase
MHLFPLTSLLFALTPLAVLAQSTATLTIDTAKPIANASLTLYGIMTEEINYSKTHQLHLKLVNASSLPQQVEVKLTGAAKVQPKATVTTLSGKTTQDTNSITNPTRIVPVVSTITNAAPTFTHTLPSYSIQVLDIDLN